MLAPHELFGPSAGEQWLTTMTALHRFARLTSCPPGTDVVVWFTEKHNALVVEERRRRGISQT